jgi:hypothetical protein
MAQDLGLHRKKIFSKKPTVHDEQWKRAFWYITFLYVALFKSLNIAGRVLVSLDRFVSMGMGRPTAVQEEE